MHKINCNLLPFGIFRKRKVDAQDSDECIPCTSFVLSGRTLNYVLKISNRKLNISFFREILGMKILRHEEFAEGCGPACKGYCGTLWSKTIVGYGHEDNHFALELAYNYHLNAFKTGDALVGISIVSSECLRRASKKSWPIRDGNVLLSPDGYKFYIIDEPQPKKIDPVVQLTLASTDLRKTVRYWNKLLSMDLVELDHKSKRTGFSFKDDSVVLAFQEVDRKINHCDTFGRISISCPFAQLTKLEKRVVQSKHTIISPLITVRNPGRTTYRVMILADPDDHEVCFFDDFAFRKISRFNPDAKMIIERYIALEGNQETDSSSPQMVSIEVKTSDVPTPPQRTASTEFPTPPERTSSPITMAETKMPTERTPEETRERPQRVRSEELISEQPPKKTPPSRKIATTEETSSVEDIEVPPPSAVDSLDPIFKSKSSFVRRSESQKVIAAYNRKFVSTGEITKWEQPRTSRVSTKLEPEYIPDTEVKSNESLKRIESEKIIFEASRSKSLYGSVVWEQTAVGSVAHIQEPRPITIMEVAAPKTVDVISQSMTFQLVTQWEYPEVKTLREGEDVGEKDVEEKGVGVEGRNAGEKEDNQNRNSSGIIVSFSKSQQSTGMYETEN